MTVKSSSPAGVFRKIRDQFSAPPAQDLVALGMYSPYIPEDVRVGLIQAGTERLAGPQRAQEVRREGLETAMQAAGLTAAGVGAVSLLDEGVRKGLSRARSERLQQMAADSYDALTLPGGVAHKSTDLLGGDALASRKSEKILSRLRARGVNFKPTSTVNSTLAVQPTNLFRVGEKRVVPAATDRLTSLFQGVLPSAEELGEARKEWKSQTKGLSARFPGWDRPGTLDRRDFGRIAASLQAAQGGDARAASSILTSVLHEDLVAAAAKDTPAGEAARAALGRLPEGTKVTGYGPDRVMSLLEGGGARLRKLRAGLRAHPNLVANVAERAGASGLIGFPGISALLSRGAFAALGVGALAGAAGAYRRSKELDRLASLPPADDDVRAELRARDRSTALELGKQYGDSGPIERATVRTKQIDVSPATVAEIASGIMQYAGG